MNRQKKAGLAVLSAAIAGAGLAFAGEGQVGNPVVGEVRHFIHEHCPAGYLPADGRLLEARLYPGLYPLVGNRFGGDESRFALPDLRTEPVEVREVRLYQHCGFTGWSVALKPGQFKADELNVPFEDNRVSSVEVPAGMKVTLFDGSRLNGKALTLTGSDTCLADEGFNDLASSFRAETVTDSPEEAPTELPRTGLFACIAVGGAAQKPVAAE